MPSPSTRQRPVVLAEVVVAQERLVVARSGPEIGTGMLGTRSGQRSLKLSMWALRPGSPGGMKRRWTPRSRCRRMTSEKL